MNWVAIVSDSVVVAVVDQVAGLDTMQAFAVAGHRRLRRIAVSDDVFAAWSLGQPVVVCDEYDADRCRMIPRVVVGGAK